MRLGLGLPLGGQRSVAAASPLAGAPNLLTTGASPSDWTLADGSGTLTLVSGDLVITVSSGFAIFSLPITMTIGLSYTIEGRIVGHSGSPAFFGIRYDTDPVPGNGGHLADLGSNADGSFSTPVTATATTGYLILQCNTGGATATFDSLRVTQP